jgi:hypothetical protein
VGGAAGSRSASYYRGSGGTNPRDPVEGREHRNTGTFEGKMAETSSSTTVSTKLERIAKLARTMPQAALTTLAHHIDIDWLREAYRRTRKDGATGIDRQTAEEYARNLEENLRSLLERAKSGSYVAPPVRRVYIPKTGDGSQTRPIEGLSAPLLNSSSGPLVTYAAFCWSSTVPARSKPASETGCPRSPARFFD